MEYWIVYDLASGEALYRGSGSPEAGAAQQPPEGTGIIVVPHSVVASPSIDLAGVRSLMSLRIDNQAEQVRARYITALPAQVGTYVLKEAAARAWIADNAAPTVMLAPEATARRMTIAALAAEVIANAEAWAVLSGAIEGLRFDAKERVAAGETLGAIVEGAQIDWTVLDAPAG